MGFPVMFPYMQMWNIIFLFHPIGPFHNVAYICKHKFPNTKLEIFAH
jgi:hypothetical protein